MGFKRNARKWNAHYTALAEEGHQMVKNELASLSFMQPVLPTR